MPNLLPPVTTSDTDWASMCRKVDTDFDKERTRPIIYRFSGKGADREFRQPYPNVYGTGG